MLWHCSLRSSVELWWYDCFWEHFGCCAALLLWSLRGISRFEVCTLLYTVPSQIYNLDLQYLTFITVCSLRPFSFAIMFNFINQTYVNACHRSMRGHMAGTVTPWCLVWTLRTLLHPVLSTRCATMR